MPNSQCGSCWNKWDLHLHTPSSYDYQNSSVTNKNIVDCLLESNIRVVAITDHHHIDVERIKELKKLSNGALKILPGIELRSELGSEPIHYIGIFDDSVDIEHIWDTIRGAFVLTPEGIKEKGGDDRVYIKIGEAYKVIKETLGGLISIHAGEKSNSIENIKNREQFQQRIKYDITKEYIDILEIGQVKDVSRYEDIVFPTTGLRKPIIIGSDNHDIDNYGISTPCWIKADPTFFGLKQIINEPSDRVTLCEYPEILDYIENNKTRYIKSLSFAKRENTSFGEKWFESVSLEFNTGLVAIVGNKGSGKSALADVLGLLGNSPHEESFSFLQKEQFRNPKQNKAKNFDAILTWLSDDPIRKNLDDPFDPSSIETIRYIPQFHLEAICDELKGGKEGKFNGELKQVIFSRIPSEDRLGQDTLDQLIDFRTDELQDRIHSITEGLKKTTQELEALEEQSRPEYKANLTGELKEIERQIKAHKTSKPEVVKKPEIDTKTKKEMLETNKTISELSIREKKISEQIELNKKKLGDVNINLELISKLRKKITNFREDLNEFISSISSDCKKLGISAKDIVNFKFDLSKIDSIEKTLELEKRQLNSSLEVEKDDSLVVKIKKIRRNILNLREKLDLPNKKYISYLDKEKTWKRRLGALVGNKETTGTQKYFEACLDDLKEIPEKIKSAIEKLFEYAKSIYNEKRKQMRIYEELYKPVQEFIDTHPLAHERFGLKFRVSLVSNDFERDFLNFINQGRKGSFYGQIEGQNLVEELLDSAIFETEEGLVEFLRELWEHLHHNFRNSTKKPMFVSDQIREEFNSSELYEYIFGLEFIEPRYFLKWESKPLEQLSPGERGMLLLIFYLLIDSSNMPLVMDQPEGNLDNQTVFELLVDCIKEAKKKRQIFIVTHNPNLAVVCDAEQVIHASLDKENKYQLTYFSGALENPEICKKIVDVLEGTKPAIDNRVKKYKIIFNDLV